MVLDIIIPQDKFISEKKYIIDILVGEFLSLPYNIQLGGMDGSYISIEAAQKKLLIANTFFTLCDEKGWLTKETLPTFPIRNVKINHLPPNRMVQDSVPVLYGRESITISEDKIVSELDIFGSSFFMLSRYEEAIAQERDALDRFPARASTAFKGGFLNRPIVNEYLEILWACIQKLWPTLKRKEKKFRTIVSCDVDTPFDLAYKSAFSTTKRMTADIIKRQSIKKAAQTLNNYFTIKKEGPQQDPYFKNLYYLPDFLESQNLPGAFYFICGNTAGPIDGDYNIVSDKFLHKLISDLVKRGHEVGIHGSYNTYLSYEQLSFEFKTFKKVLQELNIETHHIGGRQHYLRWKTPETATIYDNVGITYDTSLTYADHSGFRCGVCYEYPLYDLNNRKMLNLMERPLVAMEGTIIQKKYMGLGYGSEALEFLLSLKNQCRIHHGDFTLLWHNSYLNTKDDYNLFEEIILA